MTDRSASAQTADIRLLLRAHAEQCWLLLELIPVVRQLEQSAPRPHEQLALRARLVALRKEAQRRAASTDRARKRLRPFACCSLYDSAQRYHAAVRQLRTRVARRAERLHAPDRALGAREHARR